MKKILFYIVSNSQDNPKEIFEKTNKNSYFFKKQPIDVFYDSLIFDEKTCQEFCDFIEPAIKKAEKASESKIYYNRKNLLNIKGAIHACFNTAIYQNPDSIFNFCAEIFVKLLMGHKLLDGNKRFSLTYLKTILWHLGYDFISYDEGKRLNPDSNQYDPTVLKFVCLLERNQKKANSGKISVIVKWIKKNAFIALRWR